MATRRRTNRNRTVRIRLLYRAVPTHPLTPEIEDTCGENRGLWYETPQQIKAQLKWAREKAILLRWVQRQMERRLTAPERHGVELYYLDGYSYREIAVLMHTTPKAASRLVRDAITKLRFAAAQSNIRIQRPDW